jgi:diadenosine tetraphosphatase ApaH/serine/threonine PP2A family protein phosphatase
VRGFNVDARAANQWTQSVLTPESQAYLQDLQPIRTELGYTLVHGSPRQPIWEYVLDPLTAELNFPVFKTPVCFVGHTHVPVCFFLPDAGDDHLCEPRSPWYGQTVQLNNGRWIVNPGSVGQPRDGLPHASYAILDAEDNTLEHRRAEYPIETTQGRMRAVKLPQRLIDRLAVGH